MVELNRLDEVAQCLLPHTGRGGTPMRRATLADRMTEQGVPAVSLAVLDETGALLSNAWGAGRETLFQAASISKAVTAMGVVALVAEGILGLEDEVNSLLRSWRLPDGDGVTVRHILSHSAGLSIQGFPGYRRDGAMPSNEQMLDGVPPSNTEPVRVVRPPGEAYLYSGGAFVLLEVLLEDVTGEAFASLMRHVVLDPLGMKGSTFEQPLPQKLHTLAAAGHDESGNEIEWGWLVYPQAAGGLWTNAAELALAVDEMLHPGRLLADKHRDLMLTPQVAEHHGIGWALNGGYFQHGGSNVGFHCLAYGSPIHRCGAVVMVNGEAGWQLCEDLIATVAAVFDWPNYLEDDATG